MKKIIIDTDMGNDCDDAGALKIAISLAKRGLCEISAVASCTAKPYAAACIERIRRENNIEFDVFAIQDGFDSETDHYCKDIASELFVPSESYEVGLNRHLTSEKTVVSIGSLHGLNKIKDFDNVKEVYIMGGNFISEDAEWNIQMDIEGARQFVARDTKLIFCPFELGENVRTGEALRSQQGAVAKSYEIFTKGEYLRSSWDLITVYLAVLSDSHMFNLRQGKVVIDERGVTRFFEGEGNHYVAERICSVTELETVLEELL